MGANLDPLAGNTESQDASLDGPVSAGTDWTQFANVAGAWGATIASVLLNRPITTPSGQVVGAQSAATRLGVSGESLTTIFIVVGIALVAVLFLRSEGK